MVIMIKRNVIIDIIVNKVQYQKSEVDSWKAGNNLTNKFLDSFIINYKFHSAR
jgi:hypothetical protein